LQSDRREEQAWMSVMRQRGERWGRADVCCAWSAGKHSSLGRSGLAFLPFPLLPFPFLLRASPRANTRPWQGTVEVAGTPGTERRTRLPRLPYEEHHFNSIRASTNTIRSLLFCASLQPRQHVPRMNLCTHSFTGRACADP
jgi:hypothetical protein